MLKITATGFDNWDANFIKTAVALAAGLDVGAWEYVDRREEADFVLVNAADARDAAALNPTTSGAECGRPRIIPCAEDPALLAGAPTPTLPRPVTYPALVSLLLGLQEESGATGTLSASHRSIAHTSPSTPPAADVVEGATEEPVDRGAGEEVTASPKTERQSRTSPKPDDLARRQQADSTQSVADERVASAPASPTPEANSVPEPTRLQPVSDAICLEEYASLEKVPNLSSKAADVISEWFDEAAPPKHGGPEPPRQARGPARAKEVQAPLTTDAVQKNNVDRPPVSAPNALPDKVEESEAGSPIHKSSDKQDPAPPADADAAATDSDIAEAIAVTAHADAAASPIARTGPRPAQAPDQGRPAHQFPANAHLLAIVRDAVARGLVTEITHEHFPLVRIYPEKRLYSIAVDAPLDVEIYRTLASEFSVRQKAKHLRDPSTEPRTGPLWKLLYLAALYGNEGRLKESANYSDRLHLVAEPDFNLVPSSAEHRSIARYMLAETADIVTIAAETGSSVATVIDFSNACDEVLLLEREPPAAEDPSAGNVTEDQTADTDARPGLLHRLRSLLRRSR